MGDVVAALKDALGEDSVLTGETVSRRNPGWGVKDPCVATIAVLPRSTEDVAAVLTICSQHQQSVCVQGGLTGLVHGGVAQQGEIILSLEKLNQIEEIDPVGRTMTVQAGVALQTIQEKAYQEGLLFPLDLGARGSCQIGGNVATNAGGNRVLRYGMTRDMVLGIEAVLMDGTIISSLYKMVKNNTGYDLKQLFIGSEGTLGVVTRIVLRLERQPSSHNIALVSLDSFESVTRLLSGAEERIGPSVSAFEVMWPDFYELVTTPPAATKPPLPHGSNFYVLLEAMGTDKATDDERFETVLGELIESEVIEDAVIGRSRPERDKLWEMRDAIEELNRLGDPIFTFDISLAISDMSTYVDSVRTQLKQLWPDSNTVVFGHLGDGNLHIVTSVHDAEARAQVEAIVYENLKPYGGSVSAEHGIGTEKLAYLAITRDEAQIELMRRIKTALDPKGLLNPGRVFLPTPS